MSAGFMVRYSTDDERKTFWDAKDAQMEESFQLQHTIKTSENESEVRAATQKLNAIVDKEAEWLQQVARAIDHIDQKMRRMRYQCPICDEFTMVIYSEAIGTNGCTGEDITIDDHSCLACRYEH
jgi:uncharacterized protein YlxW (UPF0749 family)